MAVISGRLQIRNWEDKDGNKRRTAEILAENIYFGDSKKEDDSGSASTQGSTQTFMGARAGGRLYAYLWKCTARRLCAELRRELLN
jgi:single-strand DNA-binding protein